MPLFGAHLSVAGGLHHAADAAWALGCDTVQIFSKNPNSWDAKPLTEEAIRAFREAVSKAGLRYPTAHGSYLINLAAPDDSLFRKSIRAFIQELQRAESLGLSYLVMHPGAHNGSGEEAGMRRVITGLNEVRELCGDTQVKVLIETTAGQGTCLGHRFEHIREILDNVEDSGWLGVCVDTCHIFAAGYPLSTSREFSATFRQFDEIIGFDRLKLFHLNDSMRGKGSRVDRHAGIGRGEIGLEAFRRIVTEPGFRDLPMILETPKEADDGTEMDPVNLALLRSFER